MGWNDQGGQALDKTYQGQIEVRNRELIPNLKAQRQELTNRIQKIDALLNLLEKNPDFVKMMDLSRELI